MLEAAKRWQVASAAAALFAAATGIVFLVRADWLTGACLLASAVLWAEAALRGIRSFRAGWFVVLFIVLWITEAVGAALGGHWFVTTVLLALAINWVAVWAAVLRPRR